MRVLWLSPIVLPAVAAALGNPPGLGGGWIESLRLALRDHPDCRLGIACVSPTRFKPFSSDGVTYFPLVHRAMADRLRRVAVEAAHRDRNLDYRRLCVEVVRAFRPDIIHVHGTETTLGLTAGLSRIPTLVSLQGIVGAILPRYFDGVPRRAIALDVLRVRQTLRGSGLLSRYLALKRCVTAECEILRTARYFTGRTAFDRRAVRRHNPTAIYYHCDRVLLPEFYAPYSEPSPRGPVVYCTGGIAPYKGIEVLLDAAAELVSSGMIDLEVRIGSALANSPMGRVLRRRAQLLELQAHVVWLGPLAPTAVVSELNASAVSVIPSHIDNSPNSLAESMLRGAACVAADTGGIPSMVDHEIDGLLFERGNPHSLALALRRVLRDEPLRRRLGNAARVRAESRHDPAAISAVTMSTYYDMLRRRGAAPDECVDHPGAPVHGKS